MLNFTLLKSFDFFHNSNNFLHFGPFIVFIFYSTSELPARCTKVCHEEGTSTGRVPQDQVRDDPPRRGCVRCVPMPNPDSSVASQTYIYSGVDGSRESGLRISWEESCGVSIQYTCRRRGRKDTNKIRDPGRGGDVLTEKHILPSRKRGLLVHSITPYIHPFLGV